MDKPKTSAYLAVCITYCKFLLQLLNKTWLWLSEKVARDNTITAFKLFNESKKKLVVMTSFQFVNAKYLRANIVITFVW